MGACRVFSYYGWLLHAPRITEKTGPRRIPLFPYYEIDGGGKRGDARAMERMPGFTQQ
jgi:hypothetical protein